MWSLVDEGLRAAVRDQPEVAETIAALEDDVLKGRATATSAAETILNAFRS